MTVASAGVRLPPMRRKCSARPSGRWGHFSRAARRVTTLVLSDALTLGAIAVALTRLGQYELGPSVAYVVTVLLPPAGLGPAQMIAGVIGAFLLLKLYDPAEREGTMGRGLAGTALGIGLPYWAPLWNDSSPTLLLGYVLMVGMVATALMVSRYLIARVVTTIVRIAPGPERVLLVANPSEVDRLRQHPALGRRNDFLIRAMFDPGLLHQRGSRDALFETIRARNIDTVVLCCGRLNDQAFDTVQDAVLASGCQLVGLGRSRMLSGERPRISWRHGIPMLLMTRPVKRMGRQLVKRTFDIAGAVSGLILTAPVMAIVALLVKLDGGGPVFFGQERLGLGARRFRCYKFRSMRVDAEKILKQDPELHAEYIRNNYKLPTGRDPRITRAGRFLRKSSLDELPQLWNVLRGDMSLVGPRPLVPDELAEYGDTAPLLLSVKPGLAGAWSVNGRSEVGYPDRADMELGYVRQWRVKLDFTLLARMFPAVLSRRGSH